MKIVITSCWVDACWRKLEKLLPENVGNGLNSTNCHLGEGRVAPAFPYFGIAAGTDRLYPQAALHVTISQREAGRLPPASVDEGK